MKNTITKIDFLSTTQEVVTFSDFKLYQVYYTFDVWSPGKVYNELCIRKDELIKLYKSLRSFSQGESVEDFILQDYDSPSVIEFKVITPKEVSLIFKLTYPENTEFSVLLTSETVDAVLPNLENIISMVDDKEYEEKMVTEHGFDFKY